VNLNEVIVRPVHKLEETRYQYIMQAYLGSMPKISETLWYIATLCNEWVALISFSAAACKCKVRDCWIDERCRTSDKGLPHLSLLAWTSIYESPFNFISFLLTLLFPINVP
jgi:hypothetical protein